MKINEKIKEIKEQIETNISNIFQSQLSEYLVDLANYISNIGEEYANALADYYGKLEEYLNTCEKVTEAELRAKATKEYRTQKILEYRYNSMIELINAIKKRLDFLVKEKDQAKYQ